MRATFSTSAACGSEPSGTRASGGVDAHAVARALADAARCRPAPPGRRCASRCAPGRRACTRACRRTGRRRLRRATRSGRASSRPPCRRGCRGVRRAPRCRAASISAPLWPRISATTPSRIGLSRGRWITAIGMSCAVMIRDEQLPRAHVPGEADRASARRARAVRVPVLEPLDVGERAQLLARERTRASRARRTSARGARRRARRRRAARLRSTPGTRCAGARARPPRAARRAAPSSARTRRRRAARARAGGRAPPRGARARRRPRRAGKATDRAAGWRPARSRSSGGRELALEILDLRSHSAPLFTAPARRGQHKPGYTGREAGFAGRGGKAAAISPLRRAP